MYFFYILLFILLIYLILFAYVKIYYNFWSLQPVFHYYNLFHWFSSPKIINPSLPLVNKFCNFKDIVSNDFSNVSNLHKQKCIHFLQTHYLRNKFTNYIPILSSFEPYFLNGSNHPSILSTFMDDTLLFENQKIIHDQEIIGMISSRPLEVHINSTFFNTYYVDYLCVHKQHRKQTIAPQLIQTHEYYQRHLNKNIQTSLFKREGVLTGIVPLTTYDTFIYDELNILILNPFYHVERITEKTMNQLCEFIKLNKNSFKCFITPCLSNFIELIKTNNIYVYVLKPLKKDDILSAYFFKNSHTLFNDRLTMECVVSISNCPLNQLFFEGFCACYLKMIKKIKTKQIIIENISHNYKLLSFITNTKMYTSPTAFFFFNYKTYSIKSEDCLILY